MACPRIAPVPEISTYRVIWFTAGNSELDHLVTASSEHDAWQRSAAELRSALGQERFRGWHLVGVE